MYWTTKESPLEIKPGSVSDTSQRKYLKKMLAKVRMTRQPNNSLCEIITPPEKVVVSNKANHVGPKQTKVHSCIWSCIANHSQECGPISQNLQYLFGTIYVGNGPWVRNILIKKTKRDSNFKLIRSTALACSSLSSFLTHI